MTGAPRSGRDDLLSLETVLPAVMRERLIQPVAVGELAEAMLRLLLSPSTGLVELGGPERLSMAAMMPASLLLR